MDDDVLNRKEAVTGLGLLGALMLALVGVIVYRIVGARPVAPRSLGDSTFATQSLEPAQATTALADAPTTTTESLPIAPTATPIVEAQAAPPIRPADEANFESVPPTSSVEPAPPIPAAVQPAPTEPQRDQRPTFVAPGSRASQP